MEHRWQKSNQTLSRHGRLLRLFEMFFFFWQTLWIQRVILTGPCIHGNRAEIMQNNAKLDAFSHNFFSCGFPRTRKGFAHKRIQSSRGRGLWLFLSRTWISHKFCEGRSDILQFNEDDDNLIIVIPCCLKRFWPKLWNSVQIRDSFRTSWAWKQSFATGETFESVVIILWPRERWTFPREKHAIFLERLNPIIF